jgi:hypothetical protein
MRGGVHVYEIILSTRDVVNRYQTRSLRN